MAGRLPRTARPLTHDAGLPGESSWRADSREPRPYVDRAGRASASSERLFDDSLCCNMSRRKRLSEPSSGRVVGLKLTCRGAAGTSDDVSSSRDCRVSMYSRSW